MPLDATDFVFNAPIKSTDMMQFFNLLTGAMKDQPVTLSNALSVGGDQSQATALAVYGGIDLYAQRGDQTPGFGIGPNGLSWAGVVFDRAASGGVRIAPRLEVTGDLSVSGHITGDLPFDQYITSYLRTVRPGTLGVPGGFVVGQADPWGANLTSGQAAFVVRAPDMPARGVISAASFECWSGNWLQLNIRFWDIDPAQGWPSKMVTLDFDADNLTPGTAGRISMCNGKIGIGRLPDVEGAIRTLQAQMQVALQPSSSIYALQAAIRSIEQRLTNGHL